MDDADDLDERHPVEVLAEEFATRCRSGESPTIDEYAAAHPALAEDIRELFPALLAMERAKRERESTFPGSSLPRGPIPERVADFRIVGEIGRGGMGVVYEAVQEPLGRRVAVKVLPGAAHLDGKRLARFRREAETAARLHHTNIVPVFGSGEADGLPYYAMQLIRGVSLDAIISALRTRTRVDSGNGRFSAPTAASALLRGSLRHLADPTSASGSPAPVEPEEPVSEASTESDDGEPWTPAPPYWRAIARIGQQVAGALAYAHEHGTVHRDIKPANLLLDQEGVVWVTDFGIARALERDALTQTGDMVGTLHYMAPEQISGEAGPRSDIYGLGLSLYELATAQRAFSGRSEELLERVRQGDWTPPRRILPAIPRDLETIICKAIAVVPNHRYQTALALADDLDRFLEDRPIRARRVTAIEHCVRWCRRNRTVAALTATAATAVIVAAVVGWTSWASTRAALASESARHGEAVRATQLAQANLGLALDAFEDIFDRIAGRDFVEVGFGDEDESESSEEIQPAVSPADAELLRRLLVFYDRFALENADNERLALETAKAHRRVADIHLHLGQSEEAERAYRRALDLYASLPAQSVDPIDVATVRRNLARASMRRRDFGTAVRNYAEALESLIELAREPSALRARYELVKTYNLAFRYIPFPTGGRGRRAGGPARPPRPDESTRSTEPWDTIRRLMERADDALRLATELVAGEPGNASFRLELARAHGVRAQSRGRDGEAEASAHREAAIGILEDLVARHPAVADYRVELADVLAPRRRRRVDLASSDDERARYERALALSRDLTERYPAVPAYLSTAADTAHRLGAAAEQRAEPELAEALLREASAYYERILAADSRSAWGLGPIADCQRAVARLTARRGDVAAARELLRAVVARREAAAPMNEGRRERRGGRQLRELYQDLRDLAVEAGDASDGAAWEAKLAELATKERRRERPAPDDEPE